ncbi:MAG: ExbD/TolR family protein [Acidobacteriota bacterium]
MFAEGRKVRRRATLDISPLIDIAFQLIIFFAVTTTFLQDTGMQLELPDSSTATAEEVAQAVVSVGADGTIQFRGQTVTPEALEEAVAALPDEEKAKITVRADKSVRYGLIVRVIDALRKAGAEGLSLPMEATGPGAQGRGRGRGSSPPPPDAPDGDP